MDSIYERIEKMGIVPVVVLEDASDAEPLAEALCRGGLPCAEVTFRTDAAEESIRRIARAFPDMLVGAGTVLTARQAERAWEAGAKFIVSPGFNPETVRYCLDRNIPILPGTSSASDIEAALSFGLTVVKFFPAEQAGGLPMIKALSAPYTAIRFMPTGGINADNMLDYLADDKIIACGGSWMVKGDIIKAKDFNRIRELTEQAVLKMLGFKIAHVGINCVDEREAGSAADIFADMFGFTRKDGASSIFAGTAVELMKSCGRGKMGHIAVSVNSVMRAKHYLEKKGYCFDEPSVISKGGKMTAAYLQDEIGGFAVHLLLR